MLTDLSIKNIAIIDSLQITFKPGLTVLTGETGAGKSIIIDAVGLIMGGRASSDLIRSGQEEAVVEAMFDISTMPEIGRLLNESGFECDSDLLVKRSISRAGKNRIFINGGMTTLALLADISRRLINIYGQHESQTLLRPENQLLLLDAFAGTSQMRENFSRAFSELQALLEKRDHLDEHEREATRKRDLLAYQTEEITAAQLRSGEEEDLEERRQLLANAEKLGGTSSDAFERLYGGDGAVLGQLRRISSSIKEIATIDHNLGDVATTLEEAYLQLEDAAITLRDYASRIESDPAALQIIDDRLDQIGRLKKKYGPTVEDILAYKHQIDRELEQLNEQSLDRNQLETVCAEKDEALRMSGAALSSRRKASAGLLKKALEEEAHQLAMKNAVIDVGMIPLDEPRPTGFERIEFLFSPNPGEPPRPLARIASGGELSRLMLAIKQVLPEGDVPTVVFDEVDTGIGGATSELVGRKLKKVAERQQVLCITHLPQVASFADQHMLVEKHITEGRTTTRILELDLTGRTREVARMLAGTTVTDSALKHAAEMLADSTSG
jgi:DNA repair protein RecN (Recombination protein N)